MEVDIYNLQRTLNQIAKTQWRFWAVERSELNQPVHETINRGCPNPLLLQKKNDYAMTYKFKEETMQSYFGTSDNVPPSHSSHKQLFILNIMKL
jgi:hypothetical protein